VFYALYAVKRTVPLFHCPGNALKYSFPEAMHWIAPSEKDTATETLEKRLWDVHILAAKQRDAEADVSALPSKSGRK
jgi:hypothetical protein